MSGIPKLIHYCWFGNRPKPEYVTDHTATWKRLMPDYTIIEWTERNFDVNINAYVRQAYQASKYAFVSDYVRVYALYHFGGIYFDTDVEVLRCFDDLLACDVLFGFEVNEFVATSTILAKKHSILLRDFLSSYDHRVFVNPDGSLDLTTNVKLLTDMLTSIGLIRVNERQHLVYKDQECVTIIEKKYLSPYDYNTKLCHADPGTYAIHHFRSSWSTPFFRMKVKVKKMITAISRFFN